MIDGLLDQSDWKAETHVARTDLLSAVCSWKHSAGNMNGFLPSLTMHMSAKAVNVILPAIESILPHLKLYASRVVAEQQRSNSKSTTSNSSVADEDEEEESFCESESFFSDCDFMGDMHRTTAAPPGEAVELKTLSFPDHAQNLDSLLQCRATISALERCCEGVADAPSRLGRLRNALDDVAFQLLESNVVGHVPRIRLGQVLCVALLDGSRFSEHSNSTDFRTCSVVLKIVSALGKPFRKRSPGFLSAAFAVSRFVKLSAAVRPEVRPLRVVTVICQYRNDYYYYYYYYFRMRCGCYPVAIARGWV